MRGPMLMIGVGKPMAKKSGAADEDPMLDIADELLAAVEKKDKQGIADALHAAHACASEAGYGEEE